jgi:hypothetical protein
MALYGYARVSTSDQDVTLQLCKEPVGWSVANKDIAHVTAELNFDITPRYRLLSCQN